MSAPRPASAPTEHTSHDLLRVAEAADRGGRLPAELAACPDCTALHADLVALAAVLPAVALPTRPRAYTLTPADAARLRPRGWRRWLGAIGSSRDIVTRPLAIGFTTLGLAGLLVATVPGALPGGGSTGGSAAEERAAAPTELAATAPSGAPQLPAPAASAEIMAASEAPASEETDDGGVFSGVDATDAAATAPAGDAAAASAAPVTEVAVLDDTSGISTLVVVAGVLMLTGLGLFGLRWTSRRVV